MILQKFRVREEKKVQTSFAELNEKKTWKNFFRTWNRKYEKAKLRRTTTTIIIRLHESMNPRRFGAHVLLSKTTRNSTGILTNPSKITNVNRDECLFTKRRLSRVLARFKAQGTRNSVVSQWSTFADWSSSRKPLAAAAAAGILFIQAYANFIFIIVALIALHVLAPAKIRARVGPCRFFTIFPVVIRLLCAVKRKSFHQKKPA